MPDQHTGSAHTTGIFLALCLQEQLEQGDSAKHRRPETPPALEKLLGALA